jgi:hypothetical protein
MTAGKKPTLIPVEDYLTGELASPVKHEYLGGVVYGRAGASNAHKLPERDLDLAVLELVVAGAADNERLAAGPVAPTPRPSRPKAPRRQSECHFVRASWHGSLLSVCFVQKELRARRKVRVTGALSGGPADVAPIPASSLAAAAGHSAKYSRCRGGVVVAQKGPGKPGSLARCRYRLRHLAEYQGRQEGQSIGAARSLSFHPGSDTPLETKCSGKRAARCCPGMHGKDPGRHCDPRNEMPLG